MTFRNLFVLVLLVLIVWSCNDDDDALDPDINEITRQYDPAKDELVADKKEIRAAWIATVGNYDWPTTKGNAEAQKLELTMQLSRCMTLNFNAVILQVRPVADAFYPSSLEPWSVYLTGVQGQDPGYDPMKYAIDEAHRMGMEFHAWLNPYRIGNVSAVLASSHVAVKNPSWVVVYNGVRYFNPGLPEVRSHLVAVVKDIITRYDVDAIHFDDYFYPSGAKSTLNPFGFDDKAAFEKYGTGKDVHTWRADNVNRMVAEVSQVIKANKPGVLFGISPSGRRENSIDLYADPFVWLDNKWVDYLAPQIYWEFGHAVADFGKLTAFWNDNARGVPIVIGIAAYKFKDSAYPAYGSISEIERQMDDIHSKPNLYGCFFFRMKHLENLEIQNLLKSKYRYKSVLPPMGKTIVPEPLAPVLSVSGTQLNWMVVSGAAKYVVYELEKDNKSENTFLAHVVELNYDRKFTGFTGKSYFVTALSSENAESEKSAIVTIK